MKKLLVFPIIILLFLLLTGCVTSKTVTEEEKFEKRVYEYVQAFNYAKDDPGKLWDMLCSDYKCRITRDDFIKAYRKDITYPYITPFYIFMPMYDFDEGVEETEVVFQQAARIVGMTWVVKVIYENDDYYFKDWDYLIDGSYLQKFENQIYTLDWYYDF